MRLVFIVHSIIGLLVTLRSPVPRRTERGLSQSAEIAILLGGVALVALGIITFLGPYVASKLPKG